MPASSNDAQESFDLMAIEHNIGKRSRPANLLQHRMLSIAKSNVASVRRFPTTGIPAPPTHVYLLDRSGYNAYASADGQRSFVAVNAGVANIISAFVRQLFGCRNVLPELGVSSCGIDCCSRRPIPVDAARLSDELQEPKCKVRAKYAAAVVELVFDILFAHEVGHVRSGQFSVSPASATNATLAEFRTTGKETRADFMRSQALEMNADAWAVSVTLNTLNNRAVTMSQAVSEADVPGMFRRLLQQWIIAMATMYLLTYRGPLDMSSLDSSTHPHALLRIHWAILTSLRMADAETVSASPHQVLTIANDTLASIASGLDCVYGISNIIPSLELADSDEAYAHLAELERQWAEMHPGLAKKANAPELAPVLDVDVS